MAESPKTGSRQFGDLLRRARERRGMSRRDVAEATELSYPYISQLETGYRQPSPAAIQSLASALHISLDEMFDAMGRRPAEANPAATAEFWLDTEQELLCGRIRGREPSGSRALSLPHQPLLHPTRWPPSPGTKLPTTTVPPPTASSRKSWTSWPHCHHKSGWKLSQRCRHG